VSLVEFLGFPDVDEGPVDWRKVPTSTLWKKYINAVKMDPSVLVRPPKWRKKTDTRYEMRTKDQRPPLYELAKIAEEGKKPITDFRREHVNSMAKQEDVKRRIEGRVRGLGYVREVLATCKEYVTDATEGPKEEREKAQQQEKLAKARAKFTDLRVSSLNNLAKVSKASSYDYERALSDENDDGYGITCTQKPPDKELLLYFSENHLSNQEKALRAVARKHEIPLLDAEKIYKHFRRYDVDGGGTIDREEFRHFVQDMFCRGKAKNEQVPDSIVDQYFTTVDKKRRGEVGFEDFLLFTHQQELQRAATNS